MLVLSRCCDEKIIITVPPSAGEVRIEVTLCDMRGDKARIGVEAPRECPVHREEIQQQVDRERGLR